ncbi:MAG TPA: hypothetical protein VII68_05385 [Casimicrobiaceae bacterium]
MRTLRLVAIGMAAGLAAGCASVPGTSPSDITLYDDDVAPLIIAMTTPQDEPIEPIEPVEPPMIAPPLMPAPTPAPVAPPPAATVPTSTGDSPPPAATGAPAGNVVAAASPSSLPQVMVLPVEDMAALGLIADLQRYNTLGADEVRRELAVATNALARERIDANRVRLAVLYTLSHANVQDDQRALQLLDNVAKSGGGATPVKALAAILYIQVADRIRSVRDEQAKANEALQKLEALRAMERSLLRDRVRSGGGGGGGGGGAGGGSGGR